MAREFAETAHSRIAASKKYQDGYDRIFGKKLPPLPVEEKTPEEVADWGKGQAMQTSYESLDAFYLVCPEQETFIDKFYEGINTDTSPRSMTDAKKQQEIYREEGSSVQIYFVTIKKVVETPFQGARQVMGQEERTFLS